MSKLKEKKIHADGSGPDGVENRPIRPQIVHLDSIPIADPWREKEMLEKGEFARKLNPEYAGAIIAQNEDGNQKRIIEVYRQCFESSASICSRLAVVRDFAALFPDLVLDAHWIRELVKRDSVEDSFSKTQSELLGAIQTGLRSAVNSRPRKSAVQKHFHIAAAQMARQNIQDELLKWNESLQRDLDHPAWIEEKAVEKADEILQTYQVRNRRARQRLMAFLTRGHCYAAAVLIAAEVFDVSERDLESKLE